MSSRLSRVIPLAVIAAAVFAGSATASPEGTYEFTRTLADSAGAGHPQSAAMDGAGNLLVADTKGDAIWRFAPDGTRTAAVDAGTVIDPAGIVLQPGGGFDVADHGHAAITRFDTNGTLVSGISQVDGAQVAPMGMARVGDSGLIVADAGEWRLLRFTGSPTASLGDAAAWTVLADTLTAPPADVVVLGTDRVVASFPDAGKLMMFDIGTGALLDTRSDFTSAPEGLLVAAGNLLVADGANNRIDVLPDMADASARTFTASHALEVTGKAITGPGCLVETTAYSATSSGFGVCNEAKGGVLATTGMVDLYTKPVPVTEPTPAPFEPTPTPTSTPAPAPTPPLPPALVLPDQGLFLGNFVDDFLPGFLAQSAPGVRYTCADPRLQRDLVVEMCGGMNLGDRGVSGGALAALLLAAGGAVANAIFNATANDDFNFGGNPVVVAPQRYAATVAVSTRKRVRLTAGKPVILTFKPTAKLRKKLARALRTHKSVKHRIVVTLVNRATGKRYRFGHTVVVKRTHRKSARPRRASAHTG